MELPALKIPAYELPFDVPTMLHAPVDHFVIAIPVIVLLLEVINLITKKRAIGVTAFFLLLLTMVAAVAAFLTGSVDGKEAYALLTEVAQGELKEHKLLGTYLVLMSGVVLVFKLLSTLIKKGLMKGLYLLILTLFAVGILKQGHEGGELVYTHGVNVEKVQNVENEIDDLKEELEELQESLKEEKEAHKLALEKVKVLPQKIEKEVEKSEMPSKKTEAIVEETPSNVVLENAKNTKTEEVNTTHTLSH